MSQRPGFRTELYFLKPNVLYGTEKPYAFKFPLKDATIPFKNLEHIATEDNHVEDVRGREESFTLRDNGFAIFNVDCGLSYEDYHNGTRVQKYFRKVESLLKDHLGASMVRVFRHGIRKRHENWPINTGKSYDWDQPTTTVHVDTTPEEVLKEVQRQYGDQSEQLMKGRVQWINFWKPLKGPLNDWPLLVCDSSTVNKETDLEPSDLLYPDLITENCMVYSSPHYKWYYLSSQTVNEIIVFMQGDTLLSALPGVPHCSVPNPLSKDESPRESIEARCLVFYNV